MLLILLPILMFFFYVFKHFIILNLNVNFSFKIFKTFNYNSKITYTFIIKTTVLYTFITTSCIMIKLMLIEFFDLFKCFYFCRKKKLNLNKFK